MQVGVGLPVRCQAVAPVPGGRQLGQPAPTASAQDQLGGVLGAGEVRNPGWLLDVAMTDGRRSADSTGDPRVLAVAELSAPWVAIRTNRTQREAHLLTGLPRSLPAVRCSPRSETTTVSGRRDAWSRVLPAARGGRPVVSRGRSGVTELAGTGRCLRASGRATLDRPFGEEDPRCSTRNSSTGRRERRCPGTTPNRSRTRFGNAAAA